MVVNGMELCLGGALGGSEARWLLEVSLVESAGVHSQILTGCVILRALNGDEMVAELARWRCRPDTCAWARERLSIGAVCWRAPGNTVCMV